MLTEYKGSVSNRSLQKVTSMLSKITLSKIMRSKIVSSRFAQPLSSMSILSRLALISLAAIVAIFVVPSVADHSKAQAQSPQRSAEKGGDVARGKYIVESVAMCGQCHTQRDSQGNPDRSHWLQGGPLPYLPTQPDSDWPVRAPRIGGTPPADDADMVKLLTTGIWTTGNRLRFPMPQFRMDRSDAEAVVAYLKSVPSQP
jgi:mono/diheme cytochrome c family protein